MNPRLISAAFLASLVAGTSAFASDPSECTTVTIADGGWTDNAAQNGFVSNVLEGLGYQPEIEFLSLGVLLEGMRRGDIDVFLANWSPNSDSTLNPYIEAGAIQNVGTNLQEAKYALAVPRYAYEAGLQDFSDIEAFHDELNGRIHALEAGNDSNNVLIQMQEEEAFGFQNFEIVESGETGMLAAVDRAVASGEPIVFVGWSPHPMNVRFEMEYLGGGDEYFGPNYGSATVWTGLRPDFIEQCPNVTQFFEQLTFTPEALSDVMDAIISDNADPKAESRDWLKANIEILDEWLDGVQTIDGEPGLEAVKASLAD